MRRFALTKRPFALAALGIAACTALDDPNDTFGSKDAASQAGGAPSRGGETSDSGSVPSGGGSGNVSGAAHGGANASGAGNGGAGGKGGSPSTSSSNGGSRDAGCFDPHGFQNVGCSVCPATEVVGLENSCSDAVCTPFDNAGRLSKLNALGQLPALPDGAGIGGTAGSGGAGGSSGAATGGGAPSGGAAGKGGTTAAGGTSGAGGAGGASGRVACASLSSKGQIVYVTGSTAAKPFLQQIAAQISSQNAYVVYTSTGSCVGVDAIVNGTRMTSGPSPAPAPFATYWDSPTSPGVQCDLPANGVVADLGISDVFAQSCSGFELTSLDALQIRDAHGAIQTIAFVVPQSSRFTEISAQAAYFVFGFGKDGGVLDRPDGVPIWNDESALAPRSAASGTQTMVAAAIGVPPTQWKGTPHATSDDVLATIKSAGQSTDTADKALGILAMDYIDGQNLRADIRVLGFQDTSQRCAVFPDSTATSRDKQNVRDGHYPIWSPLHILYKVDQSGNPLNQASRQIVLDITGYLSGTKQLPNGVKLLDVYAQTGLVPECAMHVTRTKDGGNIVPHQPESPCSCLFEAKATGTTSCKACRVQGDCAGDETCSQGYCEH